MESTLTNKTDPVCLISSLDYEDPDKRPTRRKSVNVASVMRSLTPDEDCALSEHPELEQDDTTLLPRRNSLNVASFQRWREGESSKHFKDQTSHRNHKHWGAQSLQISLRRIQKHVTTEENHDDHASIAVFTIPEYATDCEESEDEDNVDHPHRRHVAVTFGAYHDDHNDEVIPELVHVVSSDPEALETEKESEDYPRYNLDYAVRWLQDKLAETPPSVQMIATFLACLFTYALLRTHPELDLQLVTMILVTLCGATLPHLITAVACGVYAGSVSVNTLPSYGWAVLLGVFTSLAWQIVSKYKLMLGYGGRLGATAFVAMNLTAVIAFALDPAVSFDRYYKGGPWSQFFHWEEVLVSAAACVFLASTSGYMRLVAQVPVNPVLLPSTWALAVMLVNSLVDYKYNASMFGGYAVGAYVGMSSASKIASFRCFSFVGLLAGVWIQLLRPLFFGFGGESGTTALLGLVTYDLLQKGCQFLVRRRGKHDASNSTSGPVLPR